MHRGLCFLFLAFSIFEFGASRPARKYEKPELADILVTNRNINEDLTEEESTTKIFGTFSSVGTNYETGGDIVQVSSFRACDARRKGLDHTVFEHVSVVFVDDVQPFLTGCVALDNQARFAEKSGAMALVVGPASRVEKTHRPSLSPSTTTRHHNTQAKIPIIVLDDAQTAKLRQVLQQGADKGAMVKLRIAFGGVDSDKPLKLHVFRPTMLNICLLALLVILVMFVSVLVVIKIRCQPSMHREIWLRALARTALAKMEIRSFEKTKKPSSANKLTKSRNTKSSPYFAVFGSLTSVAATSTSNGEHDRCVICLEEYEQGTQLRVLFCGHEFHPKCVDPWLLSRRRCPLCQFDVVYKHYPHVDEGEKSESSPTSSSEDTSSLLPHPSPIEAVRSFNESDRNRMRLARAQLQQQYQLRRAVPRARSCPRRRQLRSRTQLETVQRIGGYSSDVSSSHIEPCL